MAILQISRITHRKGLQENLPQLAGAEFGWSIDERRLYIGNGTLEDGAPVIGNTEILTEFSDILGQASTYTYKGEHAGYVVSTADPSEGDVIRSLQDRFDETVSVLSFGAKGDNTTNDTDAINRAMYQLFCRQQNPEARRALYFPAGVYLVSDTIKIPPHAKLFGDGIESSIIKYYEDGNSATEVVTTSDSKHQIGVEIGNEGATKPTKIEMYHMSIQSDEILTLLQLDCLTVGSFGYMKLQGPLEQADLGVDLDFTAAIQIINSTGTDVSSDITFNKVITGGTTYGLDVVGKCHGLQFENGKMDYHYKGVAVGNHDDSFADTTWPGTDIKGVNVTRTVFDHITQEGIHIGPPGGRGDAVSDPRTIMCSSAFNLFFDVGNEFGSTLASSCINFENESHVSIGDLFERDDDDDYIVPRIQINNTPCIAFDNTHAIRLGTYQREVGLRSDLINDSTSTHTVFTVQSDVASAFGMDYVIKQGGEIRQGRMTITNPMDSRDIEYEDEYTESGSIDITLTPTMTGAGTVLEYEFTGGGEDATLNFSIVHLDLGD